MLVLGINAYHGDAAAALVRDGEVIAAAAEERFSRIKHQAGFPKQALRWCVEYSGASIEDIDLIAVSRKPSAHMARKVLFSIPRIASLSKSLKERVANAARIGDIGVEVAEAFDIDATKVPPVEQVEHHRAHIASAYLCSPFEEAACLSLDGMGDFVSTMWARAGGREMRIGGYVPYPHSLGIFYTAFTQFLGLPNYGDEYKLMGLAAYGEPAMAEKLRDVVSLESGLRFALDLDYFVHHVQGVDMTWAGGSPTVGRLWSPKMEEIFGPARERGGAVTERDRDLAASVQFRLEEIILEQLRRLAAETASKNVVLAGGVALNCVVNGMIRERTPFEEVWIQPAATDDGTAIGAALWAGNSRAEAGARRPMQNAYLGPEYSEDDHKLALGSAGLEFRHLDDGELFTTVARLISQGSIVGWFQGRMEFGPRALGNRSIVCDPRDPNMKDTLNSRIKHRESFRPFAPSILEEKTGDWFEQDYPSPYMHMAYLVRPEQRERIPAVTHEDGTARLQTVSSRANPRYHALISEFDKQTGVPVVLNTSFNENEPICMNPTEAVACFQRNDMDVLVLGNYLVERRGRAAPGRG